MSDPKVFEKTPINISILKDELNKIKKRDEELSFRGGKTEEYINEFSVLPVKKANELFEKINSLEIPRFKDEYIHKVIDLLPTSVDELKVILQGSTATVTNDNLKKIVDAVVEVAPKKKK
jgi:DNA-directed RNA polymerase subunit F